MNTKWLKMDTKQLKKYTKWLNIGFAEGEKDTKWLIMDTYG